MSEAKKLLSQIRKFNEMTYPSKEELLQKFDAQEQDVHGMDKEKLVDLCLDLIGSEIPLDKLADMSDDGTLDPDEYDAVCTVLEPYVLGVDEGLRPLAGSSDKQKYQGLKKSVDDLNKQKAQIHDQWTKEPDDKKRLDLYSKIGDLRDKIVTIDKQRTDMMKKFRGLRAKN